MIKLYICCLVLIIGSVEVGPDIDMKFHQEVMEIVSYDIEVTTKSSKRTIFRSLYHLPNTNKKKFIYHLMETLPKIHSEKGNKQIVLGMDQNLDFLKSTTHNFTHNFLDVTLNNGLLPSITRPTRVTQQSATLIDNIYISDILQR